MKKENTNYKNNLSLIKNDVKYIQTNYKKYNGIDAAAEIMKASYNFAEKEMEEEICRGREIGSTVNFLFIIIGFFLAAFISLFIFACGKELSTLLKAIFGIAGVLTILVLVLLIISVMYFKKHCMPSPMNTAIKLLSNYKDNEVDFIKDKDALFEADYVLENEIKFNQMVKENSIKLILTKIAAIGVGVLFTLLIVILFLLF